jgi:uncharacterized protein YbjT (DUF2867 family)
MRITVFGATGRTGRHLLAAGLRRDHQITAFTRRPEALVDPSALAAVVGGDGRDPQAVRQAVDGADAVISTMSAERRTGPRHVAEVSRVIALAMADLGRRYAKDMPAICQRTRHANPRSTSQLTMRSRP